jgi:replicative DNA helicase
MQLPHNDQAERVVLSCIMNEGASALLKALDYRVSDGWFYSQPAKAIWKQINECHIKGGP